jgi:hypothetical protein
LSQVFCLQVKTEVAAPSTTPAAGSSVKTDQGAAQAAEVKAESEVPASRKGASEAAGPWHEIEAGKEGGAGADKETNRGAAAEASGRDAPAADTNGGAKARASKSAERCGCMHCDLPCSTAACSIVRPATRDAIWEALTCSQL